MDALQSVQSWPSDLPFFLQVFAGTVIIGVLGTLYSLLTQERPFPQFPVITVDGLSPKKSWLYHGRRVLQKGRAQCSSAFQIITGTGPKIVLPNRFADELRNHPSLSFNKAFSKDVFVDYPGFDAHKQGLQDNHLIQETVRVKLTQSLGLVTEDLVDETRESLHDVLGEDEQWHVVPIKQNIAHIVARLSSRVFLGKELCRNERWLEITKAYTMDSFIGAAILRTFPAVFRPVVHWFIPHLRRLRKAVRDAHQLIDPEVERRRANTQKALDAGLKAPKMSDTIGWMHEISRGRKVDYVAGQLALSLAAIHTTTETTTQALIDLCDHPEFFEPLRKEIVEVISENGWAKTSLYKLKLMDSFLKESQRYSYMAEAAMNRYVEKEVQLSDGTVLPKGSRILVATRFMDPEIYPEPENFDAARFLRMRQQPGQENNFQYVTTSSEHLLFGHGQHACPGRFFASNEIKIALCHLLLKYDFRFTGIQSAEYREFEMVKSASPKMQMEVRRRKEEITL